MWARFIEWPYRAIKLVCSRRLLRASGSPLVIFLELRGRRFRLPIHLETACAERLRKACHRHVPALDITLSHWILLPAKKSHPLGTETAMLLGIETGDAWAGPSAWGESP